MIKGLQALKRIHNSARIPMTHMFVVAHPDDEILGACGTILRLKERGDRVVIAIMSSTSKTREFGLQKIARSAHKTLGVDNSYFFEYDAMKLGTYDRYKMTVDIEHLIEIEQPETIYTHDPSDIHNDHRVLSGIVLEAAKLPLRGSYTGPKIKAIYTMEIPSSTDWGSGFIPNSYIEVSHESLALKAAMLRQYSDVIRDVPHPRNLESFKALARYRGGQCGCEYAEAFRKVYEYTGKGMA